MKKLSFVKAFLAASALALIVPGCSDFGTDENNVGQTAPSGKVALKVNIGNGYDSLRTALPSAESIALSQYTYSLLAESESTEKAYIFGSAESGVAYSTAVSPKAAYIDKGTYNFVLTAFDASGKAILAGALNKEITEENNTLAFKLYAATENSQEGTVAITVNYPTDMGVTVLTAKLYGDAGCSGDGTELAVNGTGENGALEEGKRLVSGEISAGESFVKITLSDGAEEIGSCTEAVYAVEGITSSSKVDVVAEQYKATVELLDENVNEAKIVTLKRIIVSGENETEKDITFNLSVVEDSNNKKYAGYVPCGDYNVYVDNGNTSKARISNVSPASFYASKDVKSIAISWAEGKDITRYSGIVTAQDVLNDLIITRTYTNNSYDSASETISAATYQLVIDGNVVPNTYILTGSAVTVKVKYNDEISSADFTVNLAEDKISAISANCIVNEKESDYIFAANDFEVTASWLSGREATKLSSSSYKVEQTAAVTSDNKTTIAVTITLEAAVYAYDDSENALGVIDTVEPITVNVEVSLKKYSHTYSFAKNDSLNLKMVKDYRYSDTGNLSTKTCVDYYYDDGLFMATSQNAVFIRGNKNAVTGGIGAIVYTGKIKGPFTGSVNINNTNDSNKGRNVVVYIGTTLSDLFTQTPVVNKEINGQTAQDVSFDYEGNDEVYVGVGFSGGMLYLHSLTVTNAYSDFYTVENEDTKILEIAKSDWTAARAEDSIYMTANQNGYTVDSYGLLTTKLAVTVADDADYSKYLAASNDVYTAYANLVPYVKPTSITVKNGGVTIALTDEGYPDQSFNFASLTNGTIDVFSASESAATDTPTGSIKWSISIPETNGLTGATIDASTGVITGIAGAGEATVTVSDGDLLNRASDISVSFKIIVSNEVTNEIKLSTALSAIQTALEAGNFDYVGTKAAIANVESAVNAAIDSLNSSVKAGVTTTVAFVKDSTDETKDTQDIIVTVNIDGITENNTYIYDFETQYTYGSGTDKKTGVEAQLARAKEVFVSATSELSWADDETAASMKTKIENVLTESVLANITKYDVEVSYIEVEASDDTAASLTVVLTSTIDSSKTDSTVYKYDTSVYVLKSASAMISFNKDDVYDAKASNASKLEYLTIVGGDKTWDVKSFDVYTKDDLPTSDTTATKTSQSITALQMKSGRSFALKVKGVKSFDVVGQTGTSDRKMNYSVIAKNGEILVPVTECTYSEKNTTMFFGANTKSDDVVTITLSSLTNDTTYTGYIILYNTQKETITISGQPDAEARLLTNGTYTGLSATSDLEGSTITSWTSSDTSVAEIDSSNATITYKKAGKTTIKATSSTGKTASFELEVLNFSLNKTTLSIAKAATAELSLVIPEGIDASNHSFTWSSSDSDKVEISEPTNNTVTVTAKSETAENSPVTITVKDGDTQIATCEITVTDESGASVDETKTTLTAADFSNFVPDGSKVVPGTIFIPAAAGVTIDNGTINLAGKAKAGERWIKFTVEKAGTVTVVCKTTKSSSSIDFGSVGETTFKNDTNVKNALTQSESLTKGEQKTKTFTIEAAGTYFIASKTEAVNITSITVE